jgi:PPIC-type PPIASE domain
MRSRCLMCLLLAGLACGQAAPSATPPAAGAQAEPGAAATPDQAAEVKVGPNDTVITIKNFCADGGPQGEACKTVITREQFEKVADAVQPKMSPALRRQVATSYSQMLKRAAAAEKRGLDKGPTYEEKMALARMQILSQELGRTLQEDSGKVTDAEIEDYYKKNEASYEQATFERIFVPRTKQIVSHAAPPKAGAKPDLKNPGLKNPGMKATTGSAPPPPTEAQKKAAQAAMKKLAGEIQARAVKGEDPDKLQKEAFAAAGLPNNASNIKMEKVRRTALPANHQVVMDLKPGEVSEVISDPNGAYYIYKLESKDTIPLDTTVKAEIRNQISSQRFRDSMQSFQGNVELNDAYFGPTQNRLPPPRPGAKPSDQPAADPD